MSTTSYAEVLELIDARPRDRATVFAFCNVHSVMTARRDPQVRATLERADVATPDGMPLVWTLRRTGAPDQPRVYGPDLMELALPYGVERDWTHYLYGATPETLASLRAAAERIAPGVRIVGSHAPPFRPLAPGEEAEVLADIRASGADCVWVGLGMPKQELWVDRVRDELPGQALLAVGAAFDLLAGTVPQAPDWIQDRGLEWAYRLWREPRRLWRRYLLNNPAFLVLMARQVLAEGWRRRAR
ncbi:MAG: WecB/TagA/CpsF family glycosyltransferase [Actinobacteria bacterium]|nr:WecB/TagA/CpsF family glycosyltransferase [Actinomycetota bacterium]